MSARDAVAVIGIGCLFPGATTPEQFWQNLLNGVDSTSEATGSDLDVELDHLFDPRQGQLDRTYWLRGGYVREFSLDPQGFHLPPERIAALDEVSRWSLYVAREALADAGMAAADLSRGGLVLGNLSFPTRSSNRACLPLYRAAVEDALAELFGGVGPRLPRAEGSGDEGDCLLNGTPSSWVARALNLRGPSLCIDAACASSLYAVKLAADYLVSGKANVMLAGAVSCADRFFVNMGFSIFQAYPPAGAHSRPLDRSSRGLISGEGAGIFVLKRLSDARSDGDRIHAIVRGVGLANDGRGKHSLTPNPRGQLTSFERAYRAADVEPNTVRYVECHATGTPVGDPIELNSMAEFFGARGGRPLIGSVKSNFGHLLTAAGMAGMTKTILAMKHGILPPTIGLSVPFASDDGTIGGSRVVDKPTKWTDGDSPIRAAVSAFGFGGTDAHAVIEAPGATIAETGEPTPPAVIAIVGMDLIVGGCRGLDERSRQLYDGDRPSRVPTPERWRGLGDSDPPPGAYLDGLGIDFLRFRLPPGPAEQPMPQQLVVLMTADGAIQDARLLEGGNVAVIVSMATDLELHRYRGRLELGWLLPRALAEAGIDLATEELNALLDIAKGAVRDPASVNQYVGLIGNIMASRIASQWDFSGPAFTVSADETGPFRALEIAQMMLARDDVDAVVVAAVDLVGSAESVTLRSRKAPLARDGQLLGFDRAADGWIVGEGAAAVVLKRADRLTPDDRVYARIEALAIEPPGDDCGGAVERASRGALSVAGARCDEVGYLEVGANGIVERDDAEIAGLIRAYTNEDSGDLTCALGGAKASLGDLRAAAGLVGLIDAALCLHERFIPTVTGWTGPRKPDNWRKGPFYVPTESRPWQEAASGRRLAAVNDVAADGSAAHVILAEADVNRQRTSIYLQQLTTYLVPVGGDGPTQILVELDEIERRLRSGDALRAIAAERLSAERGSSHYLALILADGESALKEIERARIGVADAFSRGGEWSTPAGSYFTADPQGKSGGIAFVYSGGISSYPGMGRELFRAFPWLLDRVAALGADPSLVTADRLVHPRSIERPTEDERAADARRLTDDAFGVAASGASFALAGTAVLREIFKIEPAFAFGLSLGEASMLLALGACGAEEFTKRALEQPRPLGPWISGPKLAARHAWNVPDDIGDDEFWQTHLLLAPPDKVAEALVGEDRAFITIVNTPKELFLAGDPAACQRVIARLGCGHTPAPFNYVLHAPPIESRFDDLTYLYTVPIATRPDITFYSAADYAPIALESDTVGRSIAKVVSRPVDFPRLVERLYADGARVFIEVGPGSACTRWIRSTLGNRPHATAALDGKGVDDRLALARLLARMVSHRVPVDLAALVDPSARPAKDRPSQLAPIGLGGQPVRQVIASEANKRRFGPSARRATVASAADERPVVVTATAPTPVPISSPWTGPIRGVGTATAAAQPTPVTTLRAVAMEHRTVLAGSGNPSAPREFSLETAAHLALLRQRGEAGRQMVTAIHWQFDLARAGALLSTIPAASPPAPSIAHPEPVWDEADLLEFAEGKIARVFGSAYAPIDAYYRRVRLPMPPYLLVSRVTSIQGALGVYEPSKMTTEYDIPIGAWYSVDGQVPSAVAVESGQCDLLLISYLGIDFENQSRRIYRLLDCTLTFVDRLPRDGETLRYEISIDSFVRTAENLLFFFSYDCFIGDRLVLRMRGGCAGFFSDQELDQGRGVIYSDAELAARAAVERRAFAAPLRCLRRSFDLDDLDRLSAGDVRGVFGAAWETHGLNHSLRLSPPAIRMIDRVVDVDPVGGVHGLGTLIAEQDLRPDDWYFPCHFKNDEVLAGSLMAEGCVQLLEFYLLFLGMQTRTLNARFQPIVDLPQVVRCRGQVTPRHGRLVYRMEVTDVGLDPRPYAKADVEIVIDGKVVVHFKDLGLQIEDVPDLRDPRELPTPRKPAALDERHVAAFATGRVADCFGSEFAVYDGQAISRQPNGDLQLVSRILEFHGQRGAPKPGDWLISEYDVPSDAWFFVESPYSPIPYSILMEMGLQPCGFLSAWLGATLGSPKEDFHFRNLDGHGDLLRSVDLRGKTIVNRIELRSSAAIQGVILNSFRFELSCDGEPFYRGDSAFGYFSSAALSSQIGLDSGRAVPSWLIETGASPTDVVNFARQPDRHFGLLDRISLVEGGGRHGAGYVHAQRAIDPRDWFYACHFYQDPVMPGSLGVEAMLEALRAFATRLGSTSARLPRGRLSLSRRTVWKYRGQIVHTNREMSLELHVKSIASDAGRRLVVADGSLWCDDRRIYEVTDLALEFEES